MKSTSALPKAILSAIVLPASLLLAGCGQTGALYLPTPPVKPNTETAKPGVAPASAPVPATPPASQQ